MAPPKPNAYSLFVGDEAKKRGVNKNTLFQTLGPVWQSMSEEAKQHYKDRANQFKLRMNQGLTGPARQPSHNSQPSTGQQQRQTTNSDSNIIINNAADTSHSPQNGDNHLNQQNGGQREAFFPKPTLSFSQSTLRIAGPKLEPDAGPAPQPFTSQGESFFAPAKIKTEKDEDVKVKTKKEPGGGSESATEYGQVYGNKMESDQAPDIDPIIEHPPSHQPDPEPRGTKRIFDEVYFNDYTGALVPFETTATQSEPTPSTSSQSSNDELVVQRRGEMSLAKRVKFAQNIPNGWNIASGEVKDDDRYPHYDRLLVRRKAGDLIRHRSGKLAAFPLYSVGCNILCKHQKKDDEALWIPIEFGIYPYSLRSGRTKPGYRVLINPGPPPIGSVNISREHSEKLHKIPISKYPREARTDYRDIYKEIIEYTRDGECTLLVADHREREQVSNALEWLYAKGREVDSGLTSTRIFNVLPAIDYLVAMHDLVYYDFLKSSKVRIGLEYDLKIRLEKCGDEWNTAYMCHFHSRLKEPTKWCALSYATNLIKNLEGFLVELSAMFDTYYGNHLQGVATRNETASARGLPEPAPLLPIDERPFNPPSMLAIMGPPEARIMPLSPNIGPVRPVTPAAAAWTPMGPAPMGPAPLATPARREQPAPPRPRRPEVKPFPHAVVD